MTSTDYLVSALESVRAAQHRQYESASLAGAILDRLRAVKSDDWALDPLLNVLRDRLLCNDELGRVADILEQAVAPTAAPGD